MESTKHQSKRISQHFSHTMKAVPEHRSYANLMSSFEVPSSGHVTNASKNGRLRVTKSFHGDVSDVGVRSSHGGAKGQLSHSQALTNGYTLLRQPQAAPSHKRSAVERQKSKVLKPISGSKNQNNVNKICELGQEFSPSIPAESAATSYRFTHDVSFDEGSRHWIGANSTRPAYKAADESGSTRKKSSYSTSDEQSHRLSQTTNRYELLSDNSNRRPPTSHIQTITFKEPINYSFLRIDDRRLASRGLSPQGGGISPTYVHTTSPNPAHRSSKERPSWSSKFEDLSINGGALYGSAPVQSGGRVEISNGLSSLSVNSSNNSSQRMTYRSLSREKNVISMKPRYSSKNRLDSTYCSPGKEPVYADPCLGATASFHQRLSDLSHLEAETIKYERSRKFKRKTKSDKDS